MENKSDQKFMRQSVRKIARKDYITLHQDLTIGNGLETIRSGVRDEMIIYFYVVDDNSQLVGVVPTRRLLTSPLNKRISEVMISRVITLMPSETILKAHELMMRYKLLALPLVDDQNRIVGVVDVTMFSDISFELYNRSQVDEVFESIGFRIAQVKDASVFRIFRYRFPWLTATIAAGTIAAILTSMFEVTLAQSIVLAFFLTLVLGLGESVSMQTMTVTIQALRTMHPTLRWYLESFAREFATGVFLGAACGTAVGLIIALWYAPGLEALAIGGSIMLVIIAACLYGLTIPAVLHALDLDPKIAAGPVTLAITDISTILIYFSVAAALL